MDKHQVAFLLIDVAVVIAAARIGGRIAQALRQPAVVGEIAAGIALGPSLLGLLPGDPVGWLFPEDVRPLLGALAQIGLVLFMFIVGLELNLNVIKGRERSAVTISACSVIVPFSLGAALAVVLYPTHNMVGGKQIGLTAMALFLGIAMSITAFPVLARILTDRGMQHTVPGVVSLAAAAVDDILAWTLLAFVIAIIEGGSPLQVAEIVGLTLLYAVVMFVVIRPALRMLLAWRAKAGRMTPDILAVILVGLFLSAAVTDLIGIHQIFGAFVFGAVMPKSGAEALTREILERFEQVSVLLLLPMFFVVTGLSVDFAAIGLTGLWQLLLVLTVAIAGKFIGAYTGARVSRIPVRQSGAVAVLMNTRGLTELVILTAGRELGVLSDELFALMVIMALVTTVLTEPLLRVVYPDRIINGDIAMAERRALATGTSTRTLLVFTDLSGSPAELAQRHRRMIAGARGADAILVGLLPTAPPSQQLEVGVPVVPDLAEMASTVEKLNAVGADMTDAASVSVLCRFSADLATDLEQMATNAAADVVILDVGDHELAAQLTVAPAMIVDERATGADASHLRCLAADTRSGRTALVLAVGLARESGRSLQVVTEGSRRRLAAELSPAVHAGVAVHVVGAGQVRSAEVAAMIAAHDDPTRPAECTYVVSDRTEISEERITDRLARRFPESRTGATGEPELADPQHDRSPAAAPSATAPSER